MALVLAAERTPKLVQIQTNSRCALVWLLNHAHAFEIENVIVDLCANGLLTEVVLKILFCPNCARKTERIEGNRIQDAAVLKCCPAGTSRDMLHTSSVPQGYGPRLCLCRHMTHDS